MPLVSTRRSGAVIIIMMLMYGGGGGGGGGSGGGVAAFHFFGQQQPPPHHYLEPPSLRRTYVFPRLPYSAGVHHIQSPQRVIEAHGLALPGFRLLETSSAPSGEEEVRADGYVFMEFAYRTHVTGRATGRMFTKARGTSHVLLLDPLESGGGGVPWLLAQLTVTRCVETFGHRLTVRADLLRPATVFERLLLFNDGGNGGTPAEQRRRVQRAIKRSASLFGDHGQHDHHHNHQHNRYLARVREFPE